MSDANSGAAEASTSDESSFYKLTYYNYCGLAEPIRFIFNYAQVPFEDIRVEYDQTCTDEVEQKYPWDTLPVLNVGDFELSHPKAICRYLANKFGLVGKDEFESAKCDELADANSDICKEWIKVHQEMNEDKKRSLRAEYESKLATYFKKLSQILIRNGGHYFVGKQITWIDLYIAYYIDFFHASAEDFETNDDDALSSSLNTLEQFKQRIYELPTIKHWIEVRPKSTG